MAFRFLALSEVPRYTFSFNKKKAYKKMSSNGQNLKEILRISQGSVPKLSCLVDQNRYYVIIALKMLKMEFKLEYTR